MYTYPNSLPPYTTYFTPSKSITKLSFGLFPHHSLRSLTCWPHDLKIFLQRLHFCLKKGLSPVSTFETYSYFLSAWRIGLAGLLKWNSGYPCVCPTLTNLQRADYVEYSYENRTELVANGYYLIEDKEASDEWRRILTRMLVLLDGMDEENPLYEEWSEEERSAAMNNAKEEFFRILERVWWNLWD